MTITNQFVTAGDFWTGMLEPDYQKHLGVTLAALGPHSMRQFLLFHMSDWVFHTHESKVRDAFQISPEEPAT